MYCTVARYDKRYAPSDHSIEAVKQPDARLAQLFATRLRCHNTFLLHLILLALHFSVSETASRHGEHANDLRVAPRHVLKQLQDPAPFSTAVGSYLVWIEAYTVKRGRRQIVNPLP